MREKNIRERATTALFNAADCITEQKGPMLAVVAGGMAGAANEAGDTTSAIICGSLSTAALTKDFIDRRRTGRTTSTASEQQEAYEAGIRHGLEAGMHMNMMMGGIMDMQPGIPVEIRADGKPIYTSLDGKNVIEDPGEILDEFESQQRARARLRTIVRREEKNTDGLAIDDIETLRRMKAGVDMVPGFKQMICDRGLEEVERMEEIVKKYETLYQIDQQRPQTEN